MQAHRWQSGIHVFISFCNAEGQGDQRHAPAALTPGKETQHLFQRAGLDERGEE
jgi:hypothetical protein